MGKELDHGEWPMADSGGDAGCDGSDIGSALIAPWQNRVNTCIILWRPLLRRSLNPDRVELPKVLLA